MTDNRVTGTSVNNTSRLGRSWQRITYQQWMEAPSDMWVQIWELLGAGDDDAAYATLERLLRHDPDQAVVKGSTNGWMLQHQAAAFNWQVQESRSAPLPPHSHSHSRRHLQHQVPGRDTEP